MKLYTKIQKLGACEPALKWIEENPGMDLETAWRTCPNPIWMIWLLRHSKEDIPTKTWQRLAFDIAETVLHLMPEKSQECMERVKLYLDGDTTIDIAQVRRAADAVVYAVVYAADAADAADTAAYAVVYAAYAVAAAAHAADAADAVNAADAAADTAAYAAYAVAADAYAYAADVAAYAAAYAADAAADVAKRVCPVIKKYFSTAPKL